VYVVARFCPLALSFLFATAVFRMRGISRRSSPRAFLMSSARKPVLLFFTRATTWSTALAICSPLRRARPFLPPVRARRPPRPLLAQPPLSAWRSSREAPRMAARTASVKVAERAERAERRGRGRASGAMVLQGWKLRGYPPQEKYLK